MKRCRHRCLAALCGGLMTVALLLTMFPAYCATPESQPEIGRLFFQPAQRRSLDEQRSEHPRDHGGRWQGPPAGQRVTLDGFLQREGAPAVVWLNGVAQDERRAEMALPRSRGVPDARNRLVITSPGGATVRLKPGQVWDPARGTLHDCTPCTRIPVAGPVAGAPAAIVAEHGETP